MNFIKAKIMIIYVVFQLPCFKTIDMLFLTMVDLRI